MSQSQSNIDSTEVLHQEAFVSYGKALTCKDGIIEIAGLRDVMAGEVISQQNFMGLFCENQTQLILYVWRNGAIVL
jgi:F0F1-type ATP synthase alpha subunit